MGRVVVAARMENLGDLFEVERGTRKSDQVRTVEVADALVDTGATTLSLPASLIAKLGLNRVRTRRARTSAGVFEFGVYDPVRLTVQGRDCPIQVAEVPDDCPVLIGQVPLGLLDWVVDRSGQRLIGNPAHGGEQMLERY